MYSIEARYARPAGIQAAELIKVEFMTYITLCQILGVSSRLLPNIYAVFGAKTRLESFVAFLPMNDLNIRLLHCKNR